MANKISKENKVIEISILKEHPANPNNHPTEQIEALAKSMNTYGQYMPIVVDDTYTILCGHGKKLALEKLGEKTAEVTVLHGLSDKQKLKILAEDNKIQSMGFVNYNRLEDVIRQIGDTDIIGFGTDYLEAIINENVSKDNMGVEFSEPAKRENKATQEKLSENEKEFEEFNEGVQTAHTIICPHCGKEITL